MSNKKAAFVSGAGEPSAEEKEMEATACTPACLRRTPR